MLKQRVLTAVVLGGLTIAIVSFGSKLLYSGLLGLFVFIAAWEWARFCNGQPIMRIFYAALVTGCLFLLFVYFPSTWKTGIYLFWAIWWCLAGIMVISYQSGGQPVPENRVLKYLIGCCVLLPATLCLLYLYDSDGGPELVLLFFVLIWVVDSAAFFIGSRFGRARLAERVSPGKSWEGFIGSLVAAAILAFLYAGFGIVAGLNVVELVLVLTVTAGFSVIGDLFESMFKRHVNLKDSGRLLPGHGGMLDRIDSLTAAAPVYMLGLWLLETR